MRRLLDRFTSEERKEYPITTGFVDYFPDAMALVAHMSWIGNAKHNPGEPLHWRRSKSSDEIDALMRHLSCRDSSELVAIDAFRTVNVPHRVPLAWRAMAELQKWAEEEYELSLPPAACP